MADPSETALTRPRASTLRVISRGSSVGPAELYVASLGSDVSRRTAVETLRRITRVLTGRLGRDDWRGVPWEELSAVETTLVRNIVVQKYAPATANLCLSVLRGTLKQAFRLEMMSAERYQRAIMVDRAKGKRAKAGRMLEKEEIEALGAHLRTIPSPRGAMIRAIFAAGLGGGLRRAELAGLDAIPLSDDGRHLRVMGKGNKERVQPIPAWAGARLRTWLDLRAGLGLTAATCFVRVTGGRGLADEAIDVYALWDIIVTTVHAAGLKHATPHDLRRTFASRHLTLGDLALTQRLMDHADPRTTAGYDRRGDAVVEAAADKLEAWGFEEQEEEEESMGAKREFTPDAAKTGLGTLGERARIRVTKIAKAEPAEVEKGASSPPGPQGKGPKEGDRAIEKPAEKEEPSEINPEGSADGSFNGSHTGQPGLEKQPVIVHENGQRLVARPRRVAVVEYRRDGLPLDLAWARMTARKLAAKGHTALAIARGLSATRGVTKGDGSALGAADVDRWLR